MTETVPNTDDLLDETRARLRELEEQGSDDDLGDRVELAPGDYFRGRYRGEATMRTKDGDEITVVALWDDGGKHRFHYQNAGLISELDAAKPDVGDEIVIVRGQDRDFEKGGETRTMHRYAVRSRPSADPLPGGAEKPVADIPF